MIVTTVRGFVKQDDQEEEDPYLLVDLDNQIARVYFDETSTVTITFRDGTMKFWNGIHHVKHEIVAIG